MNPNPSTEEEEEAEEEEESNEALTPSFPLGRVKKIVKIDEEIKKLTSEALYIISISADLFLASLSEGARCAAVAKRRRIIKLDHIRSAVRAHTPTSDFLLDSLSAPVPPAAAERPKSAPPEKPLPPGARRIDQFFKKPADAAEGSSDLG